MDRLFEQSEINQMALSNRFVRSATWEGLASDQGECMPRLIDLITRLAEGGVGLIITGHTYVLKEGQHSPWQMGIHKDDLIPGLREMTRGVHERGSKIVAQLGYGGAYLSKSRVRSMTHSHIKEVARAYGQAAVRAKRAGFDGVQVFAAHGFFLSQLLCPRYNDRTDAYGGDIQNRARALMEVVQSIRNNVGRDYPVLVKLNCRDFVENGLGLEDSMEVGLMLEEGGVDAIELSGGLLNNPNLMRERIDSEEKEAYFRDDARAFKQKIHVPLILVGGIRSYDVAQKLVTENTADYIAMCRPFIREPDLINRWKSGDHGKAQCISCNNCVEQVKQGKGLSCMPLEDQAAETFFPQLSEMLPASPLHPPGTAYKVSIGLEQKESTFLPVIKIQMAHNGKESGEGVSFPLGADDHLRVTKTIASLLEQHTAIQIPHNPPSHVSKNCG